MKSDIKLLRAMQSQMGFTPFPKSPVGSYSKINDRSVPGQPQRMPVNNPNLSMENPSKNLFDSRILQHRNIPSQPNIHTRQRHNDLARSLILPQNQSRIEMPQDVLSPKKETIYQMAKRPHRPSQSNLEEYLGPALRRDESAPVLMSNFGRQVREEEKRQRPSPSFLSGNNLKRSMVLPNISDRPQSPPAFSLLRKQSKIRKPVCVSDFTRIKQLGSGKYGRVSLVFEKKTGFVCALKQIQKKLLRDEEITQQFVREVKIQMFLNHPNIVKMYGCFEEGPHIYIILEVGYGGQLYHQLKKSLPLPQARTAFVMRQVCEAVQQIHSLRIIHRDIKPENIVVHQNVLKLCDFGWSVHQDNKMRTTFCGTPLYVCPQILKGQEYDEKIDIWSIGIMMYQMLVGENPFRITKEEELVKIVKDEIKIPGYLQLSPQTSDFIHRCLQKDPQKRASIKELVSHAFFKKFQEKSEKAKIGGENP